MSKNATPAPKRPRGRPPVAPDEKMLPTTVRMTPAEREKYDALGGGDWFRKALKAARLPARMVAQ